MDPVDEDTLLRWSDSPILSVSREESYENRRVPSTLSLFQSFLRRVFTPHSRVFLTVGVYSHTCVCVGAKPSLSRDLFHP